MLVTRFGVAKVTHDEQGIKAGSKVLILSYTGEGSYNVWVGGSEFNVTSFWNRDDICRAGELEVQPLMTWWVNVQLQSGMSMWIPFSNLDKSGSETPLRS